MNNFKKTALLVFLVFITTMQAGCREEQDVKFEVSQIKIQTPKGEAYKFDVEMAVTPKQQQRGLMHRESLDENKGMLFVFTEASNLGFWMKNTLIPLDMLFVDENGVISHVHSMAKPRDLSTVNSKSPASAVLEINGGLSEKLGIVEGSMIIHKTFGNDY